MILEEGMIGGDVDKDARLRFMVVLGMFLLPPMSHFLSRGKKANETCGIGNV